MTKQLPTQIDVRICVTHVFQTSEGKIYLKNQRLDTSVAEFNRYLDRKLVVGNQELNDLRVGGVFEIGDVDAFLFAIGEVFDIEAIETDNAIILVKRS
ncbi:hypothetical protein [Sedimenticola sp.]|uniref:hypothetical protein n=1 Tax=Sedimenticola sp. TaxID=1940285 RepID=UPI003D1268AC